MSMLIFVLCLPIFAIYLILCLTVPLIKIGKIIKGSELKIHISKDFIHSDFVFEQKQIKDIFNFNKNYVKIGWGDRKIFLETKSWKELKIKDFLFAFWGLNKTVLRSEGLDEIPENCKEIQINKDQLETIKEHIKKSYINKLIEKKESDYQEGDYYESDLSYNCIKTCNNWVNSALRSAKISNRIWCPITYWI